MTKPFTAEQLVYDIVGAGDPQIAPDGGRFSTRWGRSIASRRRRTPPLAVRRRRRQPAPAHAGRRANGGARWSPDGRRSPSSPTGSSRERALRPAGRRRRGARAHAARASASATWPGRRTARTIAYITTFDPDNPDEDEAADGRRAAGARHPPARLQAGRPRLPRRHAPAGLRRRRRERRAAARDRRRPVDHAYPSGRRTAAGWRPQRASRNGMCSQLALIDVASGADAAGRAGARAASASGPGRRRATASSSPATRRQTWQPDFFVYDVATGEMRRLTDDLPCLPDAGYPGRAPAVAAGLARRPARALPRAARPARSGLYVVDGETGAVEPLATWPALHAGLSVDAAGRYVVQGRTQPRRPSARSSSTTAQTGATTADHRLQRARCSRRRRRPSWERFDVRRGEFDDRRLAAEAARFRPVEALPGRARRARRAATASTATASTPSSSAWRRNGFLVVYANPRGSGSYGRDFTQQVIARLGRRGLPRPDGGRRRGAASGPYADATRIGIYGYSYGGYMTAWTIGQTDRFTGGRLRRAVSSTWSRSTAPATSATSSASCSAAARRTSAREWYAAHSPSTFAHRARTPTLIIHGEADERCPIGQAEQMFVALAQGRLRGRVRPLPRRRTRLPAHRPAGAPRRLPGARAGLV